MLGKTPPWAMVTPASSLFSSSSLRMASCERKDIQQSRDINCHYLEVPGDDPGFLVIPSSIASKLEDLSCEILHDGGQIDGRPGSHSLGVVPLAEQPGGQ